MLELKSHPALFISDMQNAMCHPSGTFGSLGFPVDNHRAIIPQINKLRAQAHKSDIPVLFGHVQFEPDFSDAGLITQGFEIIKEKQGFVRGTWDADFVDELRPNPEEEEVVIEKKAYTAFYQTGLAEKLKARGIDQLIIVGISTPVCVESTVRNAFTHGFHVKTVSDATASTTAEEQKASLHSLEMFGGVTDVKDVLEAFQKFQR